MTGVRKGKGAGKTTGKARKGPPRPRKPSVATGSKMSGEAVKVRLPHLAAPIIRGVATDPLSIRIGTSDAALRTCLDRCSRTDRPLRSVCESLCVAAHAEP